MTALIANPFAFFAFPRRHKAPRSLPVSEDEDTRRDYLTELLASDYCGGETGASQLMGLFPRDF